MSVNFENPGFEPHEHDPCRALALPVQFTDRLFAVNLRKDPKIIFVPGHCRKAMAKVKPLLSDRNMTRAGHWPCQSSLPTGSLPLTFARIRRLYLSQVIVEKLWQRSSPSWLNSTTSSTNPAPCGAEAFPTALIKFVLSLAIRSTIAANTRLRGPEKSLCWGAGT